MKIECSSCGSKSTEKLSVAYEKGTRASDRYVSLSAWALRCAPPEPKQVFTPWLLAILAVALISAGPFAIEVIRRGHYEWALFTQPYLATISAVIAATLIIVMFRVIKMLHHLTFHFRDEYERWQSQWICRDCGEKFAPLVRNS